MERLTDLPNIGPVLAGNLERIGVTSPDQLRAIGEAEAFVKIRAQVDPGACLHQLEALTSPIAGWKANCRQEKRRNGSADIKHCGENHSCFK